MDDITMVDVNTGMSQSSCQYIMEKLRQKIKEADQNLVQLSTERGPLSSFWVYNIIDSIDDVKSSFQIALMFDCIKKE